MDDLQKQHASICEHASILSTSSSKLSNAVSVHFCGNPLSLAQLGKFADEAVKVVKTKRSFNLGVLSGDMVVSVNLKPPILDSASQPASKRKRKAGDDSYDRAKAAVDEAKRILDRRSAPSDATSDSLRRHLEYAQSVLERIFRDLRGANDEVVLESLGLSIAPTSPAPSSLSSSSSEKTEPQSSSSSSSSSSSRPRVIVACRLSGGVAIPVYLLRSVLGANGKFFDGLITTKVDSLGPEYRLPLSQLGKVAEAKGQHSALLFVGIPPPPLQPSSASAQQPQPQPQPQRRLQLDADDGPRRKAQRTMSD